MASPRDASKESILYHLNDILDRPFGYLNSADRLVEMEMAEEPVEPFLNDNLNEAIEVFQNVLNHPHAHSVDIKHEVDEFINVLKDIKKDFNDGYLDKSELANVFVLDLIPDLERIMQENAAKLEIQERFNHVDKYEGFEEALRAIGARRRRKTKRRRRKRKTKRHKKRRKTRKHKGRAVPRKSRKKI